MKKSNEYLTSFQVAEMLGFTPDYIRRLIADGKILAEKLGNNWLIKKKDIKHIKRVRFPKRELESNGITAAN